MALHQSETVVFRSAEDMAEVTDGAVRLVFTSPPYWDLKRYGVSADEIGHEDYDCYLDRLGRVWQECHRVTHEQGLLVVNVNSRRVDGRFYPLAMDVVRTMPKWRLIQHVVWYIPNALPQAARYIGCLLDHKFEDVLVFAKNDDYAHTFNKPRVPQKYAGRDGRPGKLNDGGRCVGDVVRVPAYRPPTVRDGNYHVAAFPEGLPYLFIRTYTNEGDTVLDPFAGSGTTLKVAKNLGRIAVGYEVNENFSDLIAARLAEPWAEPSLADFDVLSDSSFPRPLGRPAGQLTMEAA